MLTLDHICFETMLPVNTEKQIVAIFEEDDWTNDSMVEMYLDFYLSLFLKLKQGCVNEECNGSQFLTSTKSRNPAIAIQ